MTTTSTQVGIVGAGPAGLMLSHLLARGGIESVCLDVRTRRAIETTHRAGILEAGSVSLLLDCGVSDRIRRDGYEHRGVILRYGGESHRLDFAELGGAPTWLYPQTDVFIDLADARARDGGAVYFGVGDVRVNPEEGTVRYTDADGEPRLLRAELLVGADGSHSGCRELVPAGARRQYFRDYPFAWFGILTEAPRSADELVYIRSARGFALVSSRTDSLQRMYFQCALDEDPADWSDDRIWAELDHRAAGHDDFRLRHGRITAKSVLPFRSFVQEPLHHGRLVLVGDAGHTVPPTGAKGLNLALADVRVLAEELLDTLPAGGDLEAALARYSARALARVWRCQHFSYWMTSLLHRADSDTEFDDRRQQAELASVVQSEAGSRYLAQGYSGWP